ncbi:MAG: HAMP domain-containing histidine kinase [Gemmatimonadaceae bacterium]|nr:HAMP domain-containing histidine kinase [Gemmatimonadaceae bacterium]
MTRWAALLDKDHRPSLGTVVFGVLLLSMIGLSIVSGLAIRGLNEQRARTADAAIREYGSLGARIFGDRAFGIFEGTRLRVLSPIYARRLRADDALPSLDVFARDAATEMDELGFAVGDTNRGFFVLDARTQAYRATGAAARPAVTRGLIADVAQRRSARDRRTQPFISLVSDGSVKLGVSYAALRDAAGEPMAYYGYTYSRQRSWASIGDQVMAGVPLLPSDFVDPDFRYGTDPSRTDSLVAVRVVDEAGTVLYDSRPPFPGLEGDFVFNTGQSALTVRVTLHPTLLASLQRTLRGMDAGGGARSAAAGSRWSRLALPIETLLPFVALVLAAVAGVGLWRERQLQRARRDFVASVSHELRTPLAQIRMFTETMLLKRERDEDERLRWLGIVSRESRRLGDLVENILLFSHIDADRARLETERTDLGELVEEIVEGYVPAATERGMRIVADAPSRIFCQVDPRAMRQVVVNLLDNALKYGPRGQVIGVELERVGDQARLVVRDEGPGIPPAERAKIWQPFVRLGDVGTSGGSGIGLSVVRAIVSMHEGTITVDDAPGGGALFTVSLPIRESVQGLSVRATGEFRASEAAAARAAMTEPRVDGAR